MSKKKRARIAEAAKALSQLFAQPLMMDDAEIVARMEFAKTITDNRGELPAGHIQIASRSLMDRVQIVGGVAVVPMTGAIWPTPNFWTKYYGDTACSELATAMQNAAGDTRVQRVYLASDTPGGSVQGLEETAQILFALRDRKQCETVVQGLLASAGYYLGSALSKIHAGPSSMIGSIGTILNHGDWSKYLDDYGVKFTPIHFGQHKADGNPYEPLTEQSRQTLQERVDAFGQQFVAAIIRQRGVSQETVMQKFGQGKVFIADQALQLGLIDSVSTLGQLIGSAQPTNDTTAQRMAAALDESLEKLAAIVPQNAPIVSSIAPAASQQPVTVPASSVAPSAPASSATTHQGPTEKESTVDPRIKAALYALEMTDKQDASDDVCQAALNAFCKARGVDVPTGENAVAETVKLLSGQAAEPAASEPAGDADNPASQMSAEQMLAMQNEVAQAAGLINAGRETPLISDEQIKQASEAYVKSEKTIAQIQSDWQKALSDDPGRKSPRTRQIGSGADRLFADADAYIMQSVDGLIEGEHLATETERNHDTSRLIGATLLDIAEQFAQSTGQRLDGYTAEERAMAALAASPMPTRVHSIHAAGGSVNRPGDFPHLLNTITAKILDRGMTLSDATFGEWTNKLMDLANFQPKTVVAAGAFTELDEVTDDEVIKQLQMKEELKGWLQVGRFANKVGLTPTMVADHDLDGWVQQLLSLAYAHDNTLNGLCLRLLTGNVLLADNVALFDPGHGNLVTPGGSPSKEQAQKMRLKHRKQKGIGNNKSIKSEPRVCLVPSDQEEAAEQTYMRLSSLQEEKRAAQDGDINVHRRRNVKIVTEPDLDDFSTSAWYTFDTRLRTIVHAFQRGYGRGGKRSSWFDPNTKTRYHDIEGRFGSAAVGYRGACKNVG